MRYGSSIVSLCLLAALACGDDDDDNDSTKQTAPPGSDGGASGPVDPGAPGITAKDCPGPAADINVLKIAPVWGGLIGLEFNVPGGAPSYFDVAIFDPTIGAWLQTYGTLYQRPDGKFLMPIDPPVRESNKSVERKLRVRPRIDGCAPPAWAESPGFTLGDPLSGTTWHAEIPSTAFNNQELHVNRQGAGTSTGPYKVDAASHQITFNADGSLEEKYSFGVVSATAGDLYAGCKFVLTYVGTWRFDFNNGNSPQVMIAARSPKAGSAATGSTCSAPAIGDLAISQPDGGVELPAQSHSLSTDYTALLETPQGKVRWSSSQLSAYFNNLLSNLNDVVGVDTANISGSLYPNYVTHIKQ